MTRAWMHSASAVALLVTLAAMPACGGADAPADGPFCEPRDGLICAPEGFPFVTAAAAVSDYCGKMGTCPATTVPPAGQTIVRLSQPEPGRLCLAGTLSPAGGLAILSIGFSSLNEDKTKVIKTLNADALGITQATFSIDSPPPGPGVVVGAGVLISPEITPGHGNVNDGFRLMAPPLLEQNLVITETGPLVAPFANFRQTDLSMSATFDTTVLEGIGIGLQAADTDFDFCIQDFKFRDAAGNEVTP